MKKRLEEVGVQLLHNNNVRREAGLRLLKKRLEEVGVQLLHNNTVGEKLGFDPWKLVHPRSDNIRIYPPPQE